MYTLKSIVRRGAPLAAVIVMVAATVFPSAAVFADALNPLTERSLLLSSSAPGFQDTDGSGNSEGSPNANGENFAPPGSGPNGKKTGETFSFKVSTDSSTTNAIKAFTLQYCTLAAGLCTAPGDGSDDATHSNLNVNYPDESIEGTDFEVYVNGAAQSGWTLHAENKENGTGTLTGKDNFVTLSNSGTGAQPANGDTVKIVFIASSDNYITNPGRGAFFVKMNTYSDAAATNILDGGVTVANVMTDSIHITTKVLETMSFSVGTRNRDSVTLNCAGYPSPTTTAAGCEGDEEADLTHGTCDVVQPLNNNRLNLGNPDAESSLETRKAWDVNSYWRLSSNSSGGAVVYYSGNTLANTVGDEISDVPTERVSTPGTEQFGLGFVAPEAPSAEYRSQYPVRDVDSAPFVTLTGQSGTRFPTGQTAASSYDEATGDLDNGDGGAGTAKFKFLKSSLTVPEPIAQENTDVISCATAKMRYVGNIAADTPAGVYTTKINYLAAPQY